MFYFISRILIFFSNFPAHCAPKRVYTTKTGRSLWLDPLSSYFFFSLRPAPPRRILRRAIRHGRKLGINEPFDTVITATVDSVKKYGETTEGDWVREYHMGKLTVLEVLHGSFSMKRFNIRFTTSRPTEGSEVVLKAGVPTVREENHLALWMNTKVQPFVIVFTQTRNDSKAWSHLSPAENWRITQAVSKYLDACPRLLEYKSQTDTAHVLSDGPRTITVEKK